MKLGEIAAHLECELRGSTEVEITSAAPIESASSGQISFLANRKYESYLDTTGASALVVSSTETWDALPTLRSQNPYLLFAQVVDILYPGKSFTPGVAASAVVSRDATVDTGCHVGNLSSIGAGSSVGAGTVIEDRVFIGENVTVGANCRIYPGVSVLDDCILGESVTLHAGAVIGSDGFGYASDSSGHKKLKQVGNVVIGDRVDIGANCTIDRAALGSTVIGSGTKIDNLVQIAHGVKIGENCLLAAQCGISGSTQIGSWVALGGQVGAIGHLKIGDRSSAAAQTGIIKDVPAGTTVFGMPSRDIRLARRIEATLNKLPEINQRLRTLEKAKKNGG